MTSFFFRKCHIESRGGTVLFKTRKLIAFSAKNQLRNQIRRYLFDNYSTQFEVFQVRIFSLPSGQQLLALATVNLQQFPLPDDSQKLINAYIGSRGLIFIRGDEAKQFWKIDVVSFIPVIRREGYQASDKIYLMWQLSNLAMLQAKMCLAISLFGTADNNFNSDKS